MSSPMGTFIVAVKAAIDDSSVTAPVKIRRDIETQEKKAASREFVVLSPLEDTARPEVGSSYIANPKIKMRCCVVHARDTSSVTALADLYHSVRNALYGKSLGGRRYVDIELTAEYQADAFETNLYFTECILTGEYQVSI